MQRADSTPVIQYDTQTWSFQEILYILQIHLTRSLSQMRTINHPARSGILRYHPLPYADLLNDLLGGISSVRKLQQAHDYRLRYSRSEVMEFCKPVWEVNATDYLAG